MGTIVTIMVQTVEHYFMQFNTKARTENRKSPIQVTIHNILYILIIFNNKVNTNFIS